ncbi:hypothetical protein BGZ72_003627, partial [Mortierella alpina]
MATLELGSLENLVRQNLKRMILAKSGEAMGNLHNRLKALAQAHNLSSQATPNSPEANMGALAVQACGVAYNRAFQALQAFGRIDPLLKTALETAYLGPGTFTSGQEPSGEQIHALLELLEGLVHDTVQNTVAYLRSIVHDMSM